MVKHCAPTRKWGIVGNYLRQGTVSGFQRGGSMLRWAVIFFVIALIAAVFGFLGIASAAVGVARLLFYIFLILFLISLLSGLLRRA
jgi:uncharacterized membrane protein YtjA (UPF0391 family)